MERRTGCSSAHSELIQLLHEAHDAGASDLHLHAGVEPRLRVDGELRSSARRRVMSAARIEAMAQAVLSADAFARLQRHGEVDAAVDLASNGRFRANAFSRLGAVALAFRRVARVPLLFDELGLPSSVRALAELPRGLVLVTGPTGSGKTTTLGAMLHHINRTRADHVVTIEDPVEIVHPPQRAMVSQREVGRDTEDFSAALRAALRQDPDVIFVGELRDTETARVALWAASTGHLVLSTLHTMGASETINRIIGLFPEHEQQQARVTLAATLRGTIGQRLVGSTDGHRVPAVEVMVVNGRIQECILDPHRADDITEIVAGGDFYGMTTFDQSLVRLHEAGRIGLASAMAAATSPHDLRVSLERRGAIPPPRPAGSVPGHVPQHHHLARAGAARDR